MVCGRVRRAEHIKVNEIHAESFDLNEKCKSWTRMYEESIDNGHIARAVAYLDHSKRYHGV